MIAQDGTTATSGESQVHGGGSVELTGSIYLPRQKMTVSGGGDIGIVAAQTAFVAERFEFTGNGSATLHLNMNSDFKAAGYDSSALGTAPVARLVR